MSKWDRRYLELATLVAGWSKDPSTKCGAVIVRPDRTLASVGFNGFPIGCDDSEELYLNRDLKLARVVHGEVNAIIHASESVVGYTLYTVGISQKDKSVWGPSCDRCSAHIVQAGITRVVTYKCAIPERYKDSIRRGLDMYKEAQVQVDFI